MLQRLVQALGSVGPGGWRLARDFVTLQSGARWETAVGAVEVPDSSGTVLTVTVTSEYVP